MKINRVQRILVLAQREMCRPVPRITTVAEIDIMTGLTAVVTTHSQ